MVQFCRRGSQAKFAFSLAEVLIVIGIIGVVAAMTIPTLASKIQKRQLETQIKAAYSVIQQTMRAAEADGNSFSSTFKDGSDETIVQWFNEFILPNLKVTNVCYQQPGCWHKKGTAKTLDGKNYISDYNEGTVGFGQNIITFTTAKGFYFNMDGFSGSTCYERFGVKSDSMLVIYFDANGSKKPNIIGKDIYIVVQTEKGLVPAGIDKTKDEVEQNCNKGDGIFCLRKVIDSGWEISDKVWKR